jgi:hypothetical protein
MTRLVRGYFNLIFCTLLTVRIIFTVNPLRLLHFVLPLPYHVTSHFSTANAIKPINLP